MKQVQGIPLWVRTRRGMVLRSFVLKAKEAAQKASRRKVWPESYPTLALALAKAKVTHGS